MKTHTDATLRPLYRVAVRHWLQVKFMPADVRSSLVTQALVWLGLSILLLWGVVGLVAAPFQ